MAETPEKSEDQNGLDSPKKSEERTQDYKSLIDYGLDTKVAGRLDDIYKTGKLSHSDLDDRALDALKEFPTEGALAVLAQFLESNLEHVSNKSAYLCGVMKTYRQRSRAGSGNVVGAAVPGPNGNSATTVNGGSLAHKGPDEEKIKEILERTGYTLDVTTGQRKFGGPPPGWEGEAPSKGCEVFCGKIPRDIYENDLIPLFEKCGKIWDLRLMMDPMTGMNRGYAFVTFTTRDEAHEAVRQLNGYEVRKGKSIAILPSLNNHRLFVGNIPKNRDREELFEEFSKHAPGLREVIIYSSPDDKKKNRGFCFLEYESHKAASLAKRRLETGRVKVWSCDIIVDWADPQEEPDDETMTQVKVLYVRNLTATLTEEKLRETFEAHGKVDRVKKIKDYAFVHFEDRHQAVAAMDALHRQNVGGSELEISLAKPPSDKKKKEDMLRKREQRMMRAMSHNLAMPPFPPFAVPFAPMGAQSGLFRGAGPGRNGPNQGPGGPSGGNNRSVPRGFESGGWPWGGWGGDGNWAHHQPRGHMSAPWMGAAAGAENWGGGPRGSFGGGWSNANGAIAAGASGVYPGNAGPTSSGGGQHQGGGGGNRGSRKGYTSAR